MRCAFCLSSEPPSGFSEEHVFPEAIGGTLVVPFVCKACNDRLGHSVDVALTDHTLVQIRRHVLGIRGKTGAIPNPFARAVMADDPTQKLRVQFDPKQPGRADIYVRPFVERTQTEAEAGTLRVRIDAADSHRLGDIINTALARAGAATLSPERIDQLKANIVTTENPHVTVPMSFDLSEYRRGLMKIVYELARLWLGDSYLDDPTAGVLRRFILDDKLPLDSAVKHPIRGRLRMAPKAPLLPFWDDYREHLTGCMVDNSSSLGVMVSILGVFDGAVRITDSPESYPQRQQRFVAIHATSGATRECSFEEEAVRICSIPEGAG
jgi:hypothetical protein